MQTIDEIQKHMFELRNEGYYIQLSKLSNFIEHNKGVIDFENNKKDQFNAYICLSKSNIDYI